MFGLFVCLFVLAYFRPGIITTRDIFRMQKIRVVILGFFPSSDQNLHHDFSFHRSKAAFNFMLWKRRWDHLSCKCTIIILFVCLYVCLFVFVCSSSIILIWFSYFHTGCIKVLCLSYSVGEFINNIHLSVGGSRVIK